MIELTMDNDSAILEHFDTLTRYGQKCDSIIELGVQDGSSFRAWLRAKPKKLTGIDIEFSITSDVMKMCRDFAKENGVEIQFITGSSIEVPAEDCDLLFVDSNHSPSHVRAELKWYDSHVRKYILLHDTECSNCPGLREEARAFCKNSAHWREKEHYPNNCGLTILERIGDR